MLVSAKLCAENMQNKQTTLNWMIDFTG